MTAATLLAGSACPAPIAEDRNHTFGHKPKMPVQLRATNTNTNTHNPHNSNYSPSDPLEQIDQIEVLQQSDNAADVSVDTNNLSCFAPPIQNLLTAFEENMNDTKKVCDNTTKLLLSPEDSSAEKHCGPSPSGVEQYEDKSSNRDQVPRNKPINDILSSGLHQPIDKFHLPEYQLHESLKLELSPSVINRCAFYDVIHGVNKAVQDMAAEDQNGNIEETKDEDSALVLAVNGPIKASARTNGPQVELAVLDEEKFLLAAIENRDEEEMMIRDCPASYAIAIGEVEPNVLSEAQFANGQSENPLSVLASSRTQLWKPSRSWWEAKSGKNPWIEPKNHNKRWRYLWPLIHYHKFLAKCIKKLKRNNVDVKTSLSPVSAFLREEVCAVSDHLAATSKFTSDEWMEGLPNFHGWTKQDENSQQELNELIKRLPMRSLIEPADVDSTLLRDQIDVCFLKAMAAARDQMENGGQENKHYDENPVISEFPAPKSKGRNNSMSNMNGNRPPRHGGGRSSRSNRSVNSQRSSKFSNRQYRNHRGGNVVYSGYPTQDPNMMIQPMYHQPFNTSYNGTFVHNNGSYAGHYMPQSVNNSIHGCYNGYGGNDQSNLNLSMSSEWDPQQQQQYYQGQYDQPIENEGSIYVKCDESVASASIVSYANFEHMYCPSYPPVHHLTQQSEGSYVEHSMPSTVTETMPDSANASFDEASLNGGNNTDTIPMQTPCKGKSDAKNASPPSPPWSHLQMIPGVTTPMAQSAPAAHYPVDGSESSQINGVNANGGIRANPNWASAQPLLINHNYNHYPQGGNVIPPSPATQFTMSPQANSQNTAYFASHRYPSNMQGCNYTGQYPQHYNGSDTLPHNGRTLTEETTSETTSESEH